MFVDYLDINAHSETDAFFLLRIDELFPKLSHDCYYALLDLLIGYHQVKVEKPERYKTAIITHKGLFVYKFMPFMLCNARATFQRLI